MNGVDYPEGYLVQLDNKTDGVECDIEHSGVDCCGGWFAIEKNLELIHKETLQVGKWYHTKDFTVEELQDLLPQGTTIETEKAVLYAYIDTIPPEKTETKIVERITTSAYGTFTLIEVTTGNYLKQWFKIIQED